MTAISNLPKLLEVVNANKSQNEYEIVIFTKSKSQNSQDTVTEIKVSKDLLIKKLSEVWKGLFLKPEHNCIDEVYVSFTSIYGRYVFNTKHGEFVNASSLQKYNIPMKDLVFMSNKAHS